MKTMTKLAAVLALALFPAGALAQGNPDAPGRGRGPGDGQRGQQNPVSVVLAHAQELSLSADQTQRLQALARDLDGRNAPLNKKMDEFRSQMRAERQSRSGPPSDADREAMRARMETMRPTMDALRKNDRDAMQSALGILTAEQQQKVQQFLPRRRGPGGMGGPGGPGMHGERGRRPGGPGV